MELSHQTICALINQTIEIKKKISQEDKIHRNIDRIFRSLEAEKIKVLYPINEPYNETRTDCEANIASEQSDNLVITEIIKPIIYLEKDDFPTLIQKGIVIVESK